MASNDSANNILKSVDTLTEVIEKLPRLVRAINDTAGEVANVADSAIARLNKLRDEGVKLESRFKAAYQDVLKAVRAAKAYLEKVDVFFYYGKEAKVGVREMTEKTQRKDYQPLLDMLDQLNRSLVAIGESYQLFDEACQQASRSSINAAEECRRKKNEAEVNKQKAQWVGGAAAAAALGLGVLTLGASLPFSAMALGTGAATAAGTYIVAENYEKAEKVFQELSQSFNSLDRRIRDVEDEVTDINDGLETIVSVIKDVEINAKIQAQERERRALAVSQTSSGNWFTRFLKRFKPKPQEDRIDGNDRAFAASAEKLLTKLEDGHSDVASAQREVKRKERELKRITDTL